MQKKYFKSWNNKNSVNYYSENRNKFEDIYDSEKILFKYLRDGISILDYGCAAGGFYKIIKDKLTEFKYVGIDVSEELLNLARKKFPDINFILNDGKKIKFNKNYFDVVFCFDTLHMNLDWRNLLKELWRVTKTYLVFDVRLIEDGDSLEDINRLYQNLLFENQDCNEKFKVPYIILNKKIFNDFLKNEIKNFKINDVVEYYREVSPNVNLKYKKVLMKSYLLKKKEV